MGDTATSAFFCGGRKDEVKKGFCCLTRAQLSSAMAKKFFFFFFFFFVRNTVALSITNNTPSFFLYDFVRSTFSFFFLGALTNGVSVILSMHICPHRKPTLHLFVPSAACSSDTVYNAAYSSLFAVVPCIKLIEHTIFPDFVSPALSFFQPTPVHEHISLSLHSNN